MSDLRSEDLRAMVREVLREVLPAATALQEETAPAEPAEPENAERIGARSAGRSISSAFSARRAAGPAESAGLPAEPENAERIEARSAGRSISSAFSATGLATGPRGAGVRRVRVTSDRELDDLVSQILDLAADPDRADDLRQGRLRFCLEPAATQPDPDRTPIAPSPIDVEQGAVTEKLVRRADREHRALRIGPRAVITPLARDRARALGVTIERTITSTDQRRGTR